MSERRTEVKVFIVRFYCDCGEELEWDGTTKLTDLPLYKYYCNGCKQFRLKTERYPRLEYVDLMWIRSKDEEDQVLLVPSELWRW